MQKQAALRVIELMDIITVVEVELQKLQNTLNKFDEEPRSIDRSEFKVITTTGKCIGAYDLLRDDARNLLVRLIELYTIKLAALNKELDEI